MDQGEPFLAYMGIDETPDGDIRVDFRTGWKQVCGTKPDFSGAFQFTEWECIAR